MSESKFSASEISKSEISKSEISKSEIPKSNTYKNPFFRLFTNKDKFSFFGFVCSHFHKTFGLISLLLFAIQIFNLYTLEPGSLLSLLYIIPHLLLSLSALIFHVPIKRNKDHSHIHQEYRLHAVSFSFRAIFVYLLQWFNIKNWFLYFFSTLIWHLIADLISKKYYDPNAGTIIRGSSDKLDHDGYEKIHPIFIKMGKYFASFAQITAIYILIMPHNDPNILKQIYISLMPIQLTSFFKTLVLKRIVSSSVVGISYVPILIISLINVRYGLSYFITVGMVCLMRFKYNLNKYLLWSLAVGLNYLALTFLK